MRPVVLALLFTNVTAAVAALPDGAIVRIPGPAMWLPRGLQLTPDGRYATDGESWIDLKTEARCTKPKDAPDLSARWLTQVRAVKVDEGNQYSFEIAEAPKTG
jgi:hypothetical protein